MKWLNLLLPGVVLILASCSTTVSTSTPTFEVITPSPTAPQPTEKTTNPPASTATSTNKPPSTGRPLLWSDEFDGTSINPDRWTYDIGTGSHGWGNYELEYYTNRPENARVEGGMLIIEARQEAYKGSAYTSARLKTLGLQSFQYGYIESRMKLPYGQGIWPSFWMVGTNGSWPQAGEVDMVEYIGKHPDAIDEAIHGPSTATASGEFAIGNLTTLTTSTLKNDFHVYGLEWQKDLLAWYVDGRQVLKITPAQLPAGAEWVWNAPFYLLLNLAVGGDFPGPPDATTVFPQQLIVDYVRVYQQP